MVVVIETPIIIVVVLEAIAMVLGIAIATSVQYMVSVKNSTSQVNFKTI